jgi:hypothetical protein
VRGSSDVHLSRFSWHAAAKIIGLIGKESGPLQHLELMSMTLSFLGKCESGWRRQRDAHPRPLLQRHHWKMRLEQV